MINNVQMNPPEILDTPLSIYKAAQAHFFWVRLNVISIRPIEIEITLQPNLPVVHLTSAVKADVFKSTLHYYFLFNKIAKMAGDTTPAPYLDPQKFSVDKPLQDWKGFRRVMYEKEGKKCLDLIIDFLLNPTEDNLRKVSDLGFKPETPQHFLSNIDISYFEGIQSRISQMNWKQRKDIVKQIERAYPTFFHMFESEFIALQQGKPVEKLWEKWNATPKFISVISVALAVSNISYAIFPNLLLLKINIAIRLSEMIANIYYKRYPEGHSNLVTLVAMSRLQNGWLMMPIDLLARGLLYYHANIFLISNSAPQQGNSELEKEVQATRVDFKNLDNAYSILTIPEAKRADFEYITQRYNRKRAELLIRKSKVPKFYKNIIKMFIEDLEGAYQTISSAPLPPPPPPYKWTLDEID